MPSYFAFERAGPLLIVSTAEAIGSLASAELSHERRMLIQEIETPGTRGVIVDCTHLDYFGSLLLDTLCMASARARGSGATMVLCSLSPMALEILKKCGLGSLWPLYSSRQEALDALIASRRADA